MFKFLGCMIVTMSSIMLFSRKVLENYFTYRFLSKAENYTEKLMYEKGTNLSYDKLFGKIALNKNEYYSAAVKNRYIKQEEYIYVRNFLDNLGKRDAVSELKYIEVNLKNIKHKREIHHRLYCEDRKIYMLSGTAIGLLISILLI